MLGKVIEGIQPIDLDAKEEAKKRLDGLIKPIGSFGKLEEIAEQLAGIHGRVGQKVSKKCTIVMAADHGVCEEGVSACPQDITVSQTINILKGIAGISVLSKYAEADVKVIDIGIKADISYPELEIRKVRKGTDNMSKGPAMTREEAVEAIEVGINIIKELTGQGYELFGTGEMGIGNTSPSSAILMGFTGCDAEIAVGKGAGLTEEAYENKKKIISKAIEINNPNAKDPLDVLSKVGGLEICGLVGCFLGAAYYKVPIVIDGFISSAAALAAYKMNPLVKQYMIPSHHSAEPGYNLMMKEMKMEPMLNLHMRLGEGTGCPLAFQIVEAAVEIMNNMATFEEAAMDLSCLVDIR